MNGMLLALLIPFLGTTLGAAFVFFMKDEMPARVQKALLGFASGVMVAASVWSLLIPSMDMSASMGKLSVLPASLGLLCGMAFCCLSTPLRHTCTSATAHPKGRAHISLR